jgi:hypothetical protein
MRRLKQSALLSLLLVVLLLAGRGTVAQQQDSFGLINSKPFKRWNWAFEQRAYPIGHIPEGALTRALEQVRVLDQTTVGPASDAAQ